MVTEPTTSDETSLSGGVGSRRAAALLVALGPELAAEILRTLPEDDMSRVTWEIVGVGSLTPAQREEIMGAFHETLLGRNFLSVGGLRYAQDMLERAVGKERANDIVSRLSAQTGNRPFQFLQQIDPKDVVNFIQNEHPQMVALILAYLPTDLASALLQQLPQESQAEVSVRLAMMERTSPEVIEDIENAMRARLGTVFAPSQELAAAGGIDAVVELLRKVDSQTEKAILEGLEETDSGDRERDQEADVRVREHHIAGRALHPARAP